MSNAVGGSTTVVVSSEPPPGEIEKREAVISYGEDVSKGDWKATGSSPFLYDWTILRTISTVLKSYGGFSTPITPAAMQDDIAD